MAGGQHTTRNLASLTFQVNLRAGNERPTLCFDWIGRKETRTSGFCGATSPDCLGLRDRQILRMNKRRRRRWFRCGDFPIAAFADAGPEVSLLGALRDDKRRSALRARLANGLMRRREVAIRVAAATVENPSPPAALRCPAPDKFPLVALRAFDTQCDWPRVFALRIVLAPDEIAKPTRATQQHATVGGALFIQNHVGLQRLLGARRQTPRRFAIRVARAGKKRPEAPALDGHFLPAIVAVNDAALAFAVRASRLSDVADEIALRIAGATEEKSVAADAFQQFTLAAFFALLPGRDARLVGFHRTAGFIQIHRKPVPELAYRGAPGELAFLDFVQLVFHARGETNVKDVLERFHQKISDLFAQQRGREAALILIHIFALDNRRDDRGVGRRPADALFFQIFYQRRFRVARRRLGKVLIGANRFQAQLFAFANHGEPVAGSVSLVVFLLFVLYGLVRGKIALELQHRSARTECVSASVHVNRSLVKNGRHHLRGHKARPDHLVELEHIVVEKAPDAVGRAGDVGRTNGFVLFLRVFFRFIEVGFFRQIALAVARSNVVAHLGDRVRRYLHRVRAHVGDQRDRAFVPELDAFVKALREHHGALGGVAQAVVAGLLKLRSGKRRRSEPALFLLRDARDLPDCMIDGRENSLRLPLIGDFVILTVVFDQLGFKRRRLVSAQQCMDRPVFFGNERADLTFTLDNQPQRHGLHAPG